MNKTTSLVAKGTKKNVPETKPAETTTAANELQKMQDVLLQLEDAKKAYEKAKEEFTKGVNQINAEIKAYNKGGVSRADLESILGRVKDISFIDNSAFVVCDQIKQRRIDAANEKRAFLCSQFETVTTDQVKAVVYSTGAKCIGYQFKNDGGARGSMYVITTPDNMRDFVMFTKKPSANLWAKIGEKAFSSDQIGGAWLNVNLQRLPRPIIESAFRLEI